MKPAIAVCVGVLSGLLICACARKPESTPDPIFGRGGRIEWVEVAGGRLKTEIYTTAQLSAHPTLLVFLHGDLPNPRPSYQYAFAQAVTQGIEAPMMPEAVRTRLGKSIHVDDVVAAGVLRPGYTDGKGDRSDGDMGKAAGDNYTPEVTDAIATTVRKLKAQYGARRVVMAGHSGGAAITANILGRHPGLVDEALLIACGCDPKSDRERMSKIKSNRMWRGDTRSLQPLELASQVPASTTVVLIAGEKDDNALAQYSYRYADLLRKGGVDAQVTVIPGAGHNITFYPTVMEEIEKLLAQ